MGGISCGQPSTALISLFPAKEGDSTLYLRSSGLPGQVLLDTSGAAFPVLFSKGRMCCLIMAQGFNLAANGMGG